MSYRTPIFAVFALGFFFTLALAGFATPTLAASYCDSEGNCTGPSANDWNRYEQSNRTSNYNYSNNDDDRYTDHYYDSNGDRYDDEYDNNDTYRRSSSRNNDDDYTYQYSYQYSYTNGPTRSNSYSHSNNSQNRYCPAGTYEYQGGCASLQNNQNTSNSNGSWWHRHFPRFWD